MSLLDVFKDFEYEDEDDHSTFFQDTFSQILNDHQDDETDSQNNPGDDKKEDTPLPPSKKAKPPVQDFEEAFTVLKSIDSAHQPLSYTAINAYLHHLRNSETNQRTVHGLVWPEHPQTFNDSRLLSNPPDTFTDQITSERIPHLLTDVDSSEDDEPLDTLNPCKMSQSPHLHRSLLRTVYSIFLHKTRTNPTASLDPRLAHSIARCTALLLQTVFTRAALNRRSAVRVLKRFPRAHQAVDIDNVPSNWETTKLAAEQLVGQAALDQETFMKFADRVDKTFK